MASILNVASCGGADSTFNSGTPLCDVIRDIPYGLILLDSGVEFDSTDLASVAAFVAALDTATRAARGSRAYPIWALTNFEDQSKEPTKGALGNLTNSEIQLVDGIPAFAFEHRKGDFFHQLLAKAESGGFTLLIVDKKYAVYGTKTSNNTLAGFSLAEFKAQLPKFQTPQGASKYPFSVILDSITEYKENLAIVQADSTIVNISGLRDITLSKFNAVSNVVKVAAVGVGGKNIAELFAVELAQAAAWIVTNVALGTTATVSAAYDSTNKVIALTLSGTPWTGASTGDDFTVDLVSASALAGLASPIDGYESAGSFTFDKP